jgi:hypothetical protein
MLPYAEVESFVVYHASTPLPTILNPTILKDDQSVQQSYSIDLQGTLWPRLTAPKRNILLKIQVVLCTDFCEV